jgi:hypothetical protein
MRDAAAALEHLERQTSLASSQRKMLAFAVGT